MLDQILSEETKVPAENSKAVGKSKNEPAACTIQGMGWLKSALGMAICCSAPILLIAAISFFGLSLGALASGALSLAALLACPGGMFLMMRVMMVDKRPDQLSRK
jgi:hypothetical protein